MKIAMPLLNGVVAAHFGHCEEFALITVDLESKKIVKLEKAVPPAHEPGVLPRWLVEQKVELVIAGGMGGSASSLLNEKGVKVIVGASSETPEKLIEAYLSGALEEGTNACDH